MINHQKWRDSFSWCRAWPSLRRTTGVKNAKEVQESWPQRNNFWFGPFGPCFIPEEWHACDIPWVFAWLLNGFWMVVITFHFIWLVVSTPLKNTSQLGWVFPIYGKIKNVPNHQPVMMPMSFWAVPHEAKHSEGKGWIPPKAADQPIYIAPFSPWISSFNTLRYSNMAVGNPL